MNGNTIIHIGFILMIIGSGMIAYTPPEIKAIGGLVTALGAYIAAK